MLMDLISCCGLYFSFFSFSTMYILTPRCCCGEAEDGDEPGEQDFDGGGKLEREL